MAFDEWRQQRAEKRVKPGDGRPLAPYRWWQTFSRSVFSLRLSGSSAEYVVDVRTTGDASDGEVRARLYRNGAQIAVSRVPARFAVEGGFIEVEATWFGMRRCHFVDANGVETPLTPHPRSGEGRRARLHNRYPAASQVVSAVATIVVVVGAGLGLLQLLQPISQIPPINDVFGTFVSPIQLSVWANVGVGLLVALASTERALRMRSSWLDALAS